MSVLTDELNMHKRKERHQNAAESRYWCGQYRQLAERAIYAVCELERENSVELTDEEIDLVFKHELLPISLTTKWQVIRAVRICIAAHEAKQAGGEV